MTDKIAGTNKNIVNTRLCLTIKSPHCPDITLIDLPGITKVQIKGSDQNENIEKFTKDLVN